MYTSVLTNKLIVRQHVLLIPIYVLLGYMYIVTPTLLMATLQTRTCIYSLVFRKISTVYLLCISAHYVHCKVMRTYTCSCQMNGTTKSNEWNNKIINARTERKNQLSKIIISNHSNVAVCENTLLEL